MRAIEELRRMHEEAGAQGWRRGGDTSLDLRRRIVGVDGRTVALCNRPAWADAALAAVSALPALLDVAEAAQKMVAGCDCRGTGIVDLGCRFCGDSTYDHFCEERTAECVECLPLRTALARLEEGT